ncbi:MAG: ABC transporter permease subunit [Gemmataceae bacterium]|nr:ABC transporter permease subunit [Gemmataceae bacterium]
MSSESLVDSAPSPWRAWTNLVLLSLRRQARAHWLVWVSVGLLALSAFIVHINTSRGRWTMGHFRSPRRSGITFEQRLVQVKLAGQVPWSPEARGVHFATTAAWATVTHITSALPRFSNWIVFFLFATFLLPLWTLSFATEALGREREAQTLIWTLVRPIPRPAIYLAKYLALLPWCLAFNLGGLFLLCWLGGEPGRTAFTLYWPAALWGTLAFAALFHLMGASLRRAGIVALLYAFFLETVAGNLPGNFKRLSISFYMRCLMFEHGQDYGIGPERPWIYLPVSDTTAWLVLAGATAALLVAGMVVFSRSEYLDVR